MWVEVRQPSFFAGGLKDLSYRISISPEQRLNAGADKLRVGPWNDIGLRECGVVSSKVSFFSEVADPVSKDFFYVATNRVEVGINGSFPALDFCVLCGLLSLIRGVSFLGFGVFFNEGLSCLTKSCLWLRY